MKGYFKFLFKSFVEFFKEVNVVDKIILIIDIISIPLLFVALNYEMIDSIINGPAWAAIILSYLNLLVFTFLTVVIILSIEFYIDTED